MASGHHWMARGDVSCVCLAAPLHELVGASVVPPNPLWGLSTPYTQSSGDTETGWLCIFPPQHFIYFLQQMGSEPRVRAFPGEGDHSVLYGRARITCGAGVVLDSPTWEHVWTQGGDVS